MKNKPQQQDINIQSPVYGIEALVSMIEDEKELIIALNKEVAKTQRRLASFGN